MRGSQVTNRLKCNSLDSTSRTASASFYVSDTDWYSMGDFERNRDISPAEGGGREKSVRGSLVWMPRDLE